MPTVTDIPAERWGVRSDFSDAPAAMSYDVTYRTRKADGTFDPVFLDGVKVYRGEADPDKVRIRPTIEGITETLLLGIVDRNGVARDADAKGVLGALTGRDLIALALDTYPAEAFTLDGMVGAGASYRETFYGAMRELAERAGLFAVFDCPDYRLGTSLPVPADRTLGEAMQELLRPFRWSEKHRVDVWVEGEATPVLRVARRGNNARGVVVVDASRVLVEAMEKTALPIVDDVRVEGASYETEVPDGGGSGGGTPDPGGNPYSVSYGPTTISKTVAGKLTSYVEDGTRWYDGQGRQLAEIRRVVYLILDGQATTRSELHQRTSTFWVDSTKPFDGAPKNEAESYIVTQLWPAQAGGFTSGPETVSVKSTDYTYYEDNGDTFGEDVFELERDEGGASPLPDKLNRSTRVRWRRSGGRVLKDVEIVEVDVGTNIPQRSFATTVIGPFNADAGQVSGGAARPGYRMERGQIAAGPEPTSGRFRVESSELLGHEDDCEAIRQDLIDEHASVRWEAAFAMVPDLRVKPGVVLTVQNAPAWWPVASFTVTGVQKDRDQAGYSMRVQAVAWEAAP